MAVATALLLLEGCAATRGAASHGSNKSSEALLRAGDQVDVSLSSTTSDLALFDADARRVAAEISHRLDSGAGPLRGTGDRYKIDVAIVNYDKGNNYVRAMLAGLGQIHTDAVVKVFRLPSNTAVSEFTVSKTFAPGGIYGSASRIQDIEAPFIQSVVDALQGSPAADNAEGPRVDSPS